MSGYLPRIPVPRGSSLSSSSPTSFSSFSIFPSRCFITAIKCARGRRFATTVKMSKPAVFTFKSLTATRLSRTVYHLTPSITSTKRAGDPKLILLCTWMAAKPVHISKYITTYTELYPSSPILLVRSPLDYIFNPFWRATLVPAVNLLREFNSTLGSSKDEKSRADEAKILVHTFSNGGMSSLREIFEKLTSQGQLNFPRYNLILDSCPGYFHYSQAFAAFGGLTPKILHPFVHLWLVCAVLFYRYPGFKTFLELNPLGLRKRHLLEMCNRRTYIYGTKDNLIHERDVEDDAAKIQNIVEDMAKERKADIGEGKEGGLGGDLGPVVKMEKFVGGEHVQHARMDGKRYWTIVKETWEER